MTINGLYKKNKKTNAKNIKKTIKENYYTALLEIKNLDPDDPAFDNYGYDQKLALLEKFDIFFELSEAYIKDLEYKIYSMVKNDGIKSTNRKPNLKPHNNDPDIDRTNRNHPGISI
jgi:hypothetical protein